MRRIIWWCLAVALGLSFGVQAGSDPDGEIKYLKPVYKTAGVPASGIDHWVTNSVSDYTVVASSGSAVTWGASDTTSWYVVKDADVDILGGVTCRGHVNLILCDGAKLFVTNVVDEAAGIETDPSGLFEIYGQPDGFGELMVIGGREGAGIGGGNQRSGSAITINGGQVTAIGGSSAAGIGGGTQCSGFNITINGGQVLASGGTWSSAIGGGFMPCAGLDTSGHHIVINGGTVFALGAGDVIGTGDKVAGQTYAREPSHDNYVSSDANLFVLSQYMNYWSKPIAVPDKVDGFVVQLPETPYFGSYVLMGGVCGFGHTTALLTNTVTHTSVTLVVDDETMVPFDDIKVSLRRIGERLTLFVGGPITVTPKQIAHAQIVGVYTNGVATTETSEGSGTWNVCRYEPAMVVYEITDPGYHFQDGSTVMTNQLDTTVDPVQNCKPLPSPLAGDPVAELRSGEGEWLGVFDSLANAISGASEGETIVLLTDLSENVSFSASQTYTLDLAGRTLTPAVSTAPIVTVAANAKVTIIDTPKSGSITTGGQKSDCNGAGISVAGALSLCGVTMTNCWANGNGGAIYGGTSAKLLVKDCTFRFNKAEENGGALCLMGTETSGKGVLPSDKCLLIRSVITDNSVGLVGGGVYYKSSVEASCLAAGTRVRMADGSEKLIEDVVEGDVVATFDHAGGTNSSARVYLASKGENKAVPYTLEFDAPLSTSTSSLHLSIVGCHDLLLKDTRKYVTITAGNVGQYIGAKFYGADGAWHTLTNVTMGTEPVDYYSLYSAQHQNVYANGLLTVSDDVDYLLNIYALDEDLEADAAQLAADVAQYGLTSFEEAEAIGMSRAWYDDAGTKYMNIAVGKQLVSREYVESLFASTGRAMKRLASSKRLMASPLMATAAPADPTLADVDIGALTLGEGVVVRNNFHASVADNIYLDFEPNGSTVEKGSFIALASVHTGICAGVTCAWTKGQFTTTSNVAASDGVFFTSDNPAYGVDYDSGNRYLVLSSGPVKVTKNSQVSYHDGISAAFDAIGENGTGTVTLLGDLTLVQDGAASLPDGSDITLDLSGRRIDWTTTNGDALLFIPENTDGKLTITDSASGGGTITSVCTSQNEEDSALVVFCAGNGDLTVNGGTFVSSNGVGCATLFYKNGNGDWNFNGGTCSAYGQGARGASFLYFGEASGTTVISGGKYSVTAPVAGVGIGASDLASERVVITDGDFDVTSSGTWYAAFTAGNGSLVVKGGDFFVKSSGTGISCIGAERGGTVILSNGTFRTESTGGYAYAASSTGTATLEIAGGEYFAKAGSDTAASVIGKEQSKLTLVGAPVIHEPDGTAWNLAVQLFGATFDFSGYTGANLPSFAVFADGTYGPSYVTGDMARFNNASIWAGYFSTRPNDWNVLEGNLPLINVDAATKATWPWVIGKGVAEAGTSRGDYYAQLGDAWSVAAAEEKKGLNVFVRLLADTTVTNTLLTGDTGVMTLDLNDHVLAYAGKNAECIVQQLGGTLHVVDTAATRTPRYFTCDETGLWTLTNEVTELSVSGGLLTGGRNRAIYYAYNSSGHSISNVNLVGNYSANDGGAVMPYSFSMEVSMIKSAFVGNVSGGNGGAISAGICHLTDCRVEANVAALSGGGVNIKKYGSLVRTKVVGNTAKTAGGVNVMYNPGGCFPAGVRVLMADGSEKTIENIVKGDVVATFDHVGGTNSSAAVFYVYRGQTPQNVFTLSFASGAMLEIADRHDLLLEATRKYVTVSSDDARAYLGQRFYNYATGAWDELVGVKSVKECDASYSLYTRGHANCVVNGLLTVPDDKDCFINIYELDEDLKADAERLAADIEEYGLATRADYPNVPVEDFEDGNVRFSRIAIGKGLVTDEQIRFWNEFDYGPVVKMSALAPKLMMAAPKLMSATPVATPQEPYLSVGEGTIVTGNVSTAGKSDNIYLVSNVGKDPVIAILPDAENLTAGVALSAGAGVFGFTNETNYAASFFADDPQYSIVYTDARELKLGIPVAYVAPVYVGGVAAQGIDHWVTNSILLSDATVVTGETTAWSDGWYVVKDADVRIDGGVTCEGEVHLILCDGAKLTVSVDDDDEIAAIATQEDSSFAIYGQPDGAGELDATGAIRSAAIGGNKTDPGLNITINGGTINAIGGYWASGIGGGYGGDCENVTINGGFVHAKAGELAAAIGGGQGGDSEGITLNGGTIVVSGPDDFSTISSLIGSEGFLSESREVRIASDAQVLFDLTGGFAFGDFDGFGILTPEQLMSGVTLVNGLEAWSATADFALAKSGQLRGKTIVVNGDAVPFAGKMITLTQTDGKLAIGVGDLPDQPILKDKDGEEIKVVVPQAWRKDHDLQDEDVVDPKNPLDNGMPAWQSYVLGLDPTNELSGIYADAAQNAKTNIVTVNTRNFNPLKLVAGYDVKYRLDTKLKEATEYTRGTVQDAPDFDVEVEESDPTGIYQLNAVIYSNGVEIAESAKAVNQVGFVKATQAQKLAIVAVPWGGLAPGEKHAIAVSNLVKTAGLAEGDKLHVLRPDTRTYDTWILNSNLVWESVMSCKLDAKGRVTKSVSGAAAQTTVERGNGVWLERADPSRPYVLYGQYDAAATDYHLGSGANLLAAPDHHAFDLNKIKGAQNGDQIQIPTPSGVPKLYTFKDGQWGYYKSVPAPGSYWFKGKLYGGYVSEWFTDDAEVPAGTGYLLMNNSGEVSVE